MSILETDDVTDDIRRLTLNRPDSLNALSRALLSRIAEEIRAADGEYRVLILEGAGDAFTAGADLDEEEGAGDLFQEITRAVREFEGIVIGKLHGWVIGGGFEWTLSFDLCYAHADTTFKLTESEIGVTVTNASTLLLPLYVGAGTARELVYTSRELPAAEAEQYGLLAGVYDDADDLEAKVLDVATDIVENKSATALRLNKRAMDQAFPVEEVLKREELINEYCHDVEDMSW
ncbi:enoyl-CoA hydratase/isomerase family protein [Natrinema gelatinilyticum]|uniref:enoyl-CoA hydratase/isomerase family protein n=1 Tax=Natrinema gelatinilyticum TaxID=2961571 RepID=UPI0020C50D4C|nr:enoyl-CoA hydratase/isomerase family protein [Natrinema gelatinilyticum]